LNSDWQDQMDTIRISQINPTHMYTETVQTYSSSDVAVYKLDFGCCLVGSTSCLSIVAGWLCDRWKVRFNSYYNPFTTAEKKHIICHEFGHTLGLHHYPDSNPSPNSCMKEADLHTYSDHDVFHINDYYTNNPNG
jgi:hypothetical protein